MKRILIFGFVLVMALTEYQVSGAAYQPVDVDIWVDIVNGGTVQMVAEVNCPLPQKSNIKLKDGDMDAFHITFSEIGDYSYTVKVVPDKRNMNFDQTVYNIKCYVRDDEGKLVVTTIIYNLETGKKYQPDSQKPELSVSFSNVKSASHEKEETTNEGKGEGDRGVGSRPKTGDDSQLDKYLIMCMLTSASLFALSVAYYKSMKPIVNE